MLLSGTRVEKNNMEPSAIFQLVLGVAIAAMGFFMKRAFDQLDQSVKRIRDVEIDVATLAAENRDMHDRLERIENKIDRLLGR